jgi:hypothetical protein
MPNLLVFVLSIEYYDKIQQLTKRNAIGTGKPMSDQHEKVLASDEVTSYRNAGGRTLNHIAANEKLPYFKLGGTCCIVVVF